MKDLLERLHKQLEQVLFDRRLLGPNVAIVGATKISKHCTNSPYAVQQFPWRLGGKRATA